MSERRVIRFGVVPLAAIDRELAEPRYCRNCGDPFGADAEAAAMRQPHGAWRPCPNPSPGRPLVDCGIGGHMYSDAAPEMQLTAMGRAARYVVRLWLHSSYEWVE